MVGEYATDLAVIEFLVLAGDSSPKDIGVCVLGHSDGTTAWKTLNRLRTKGYVKKVGHGVYAGVWDVACARCELF